MAKHPELTGDFLHVPGYVQATDPGAVGGGKLWIDTSAGSGNWQTKIRNTANTAWEAVSGGGAGATNFPALSDTPANYAGAAGYKVVVNGTETGLIFIPDSGGGAFLPLDGSSPMVGNIYFSTPGQGILFDDGNSTPFSAIRFDLTGDPEIIIGEEAVDIGGHPIVRANSGIFRVGEGPGVGFAALEMWSEDQGNYEPVILSISDGPGDPLEISTPEHATNINGSETRPTYNGSELALLSDVGGPAFLHYNVGVGRLKMVCVSGVTSAASGTVTEVVRVRFSDLLKSVDGGGASPTFSFQDLSGLTTNIVGNGGTDPTAIYIDYLNSQEWAGGFTAILNMKVDDGVQPSYVQLFVNLGDTDAIGGW